MPSFSSLPCAQVALILSFALGATSLDAQSNPQDLLTVVPNKVDPFAKQLGVARSRVVRVDTNLLDRSKPGDVVRVALFRDTVFVAHLTDREDVGAGHFIWTGSLAGLPQSSFVIAVAGGRVDANFFPRDGRVNQFAVQSAPGMQVAREIKWDGRRPTAIPMPPGQPTREVACNDNPDEILLLVVYDRLAASQIGASAIRSTVDARLKYLNDTMKNSQLNLRYRLATTPRPVNYTTGSLLLDIARLRSSTDKVMDEVHTWRNQYAADLVAMLVGVDRKNHGNTVGVGYVQTGFPLNSTLGFTVSEWGQADTLAHEVGHNMGCQHDPASIKDPKTLIYPYARGHRFGIPLFGFATLMAYRNVSYPTRAQILSGPTLKWGAWNTGGALNDNRRTILNTRQHIANFRRTNTRPSITRHPVSTSRCQGYQINSVIMSITATKAPRYTNSYQWYRNGRAVPGQTRNYLSIANITHAHAGNYNCRVANNCGSATSKTVKLTVSSSCNTRRFTGASGSFYGFSVSRAGDFDRDGYEDFVIGEPYAKTKGTYTGGIQVRSGKTSAVLLSLNYAAGEKFGYSVAAAGDVDQDGYADVIVGAPQYASGRGYARVISGKTRGQKYIFFGDPGPGSFGHSVCGLGDVDGDGHPDVAVGAPLHNRVRIFSGRTGSALRTLTGSANERFGWCVAAAGDIDQDGFDDIAVGAPYWSGYRGYVRIFSGRKGTILHTVFGTAVNTHLGQSVAGIGDADLDGVPDLAIGAPYADVKGGNSGQVLLLSGRTKKVLFDMKYAAGEQLGYSVAAAGDVNGDGRADILVGAPGWNGYRGYVRTLSGVNGQQLRLALGLTTSGRRGHSVSGFEANGDATPDMLVGAYGANTVWLFDGPLAANPPEIEIFGAACLSPRSTLPHVAFKGRAAIGKVFEPSLYAGSQSVSTWFMIDAVRSNVPLSILGAPGCTAYAMPNVVLGTSTNSAGRAGFKLPLPNQTGLIGAEVFAQWVLFDPAAAGGLVTSNAARLKMGRQ